MNRPARQLTNLKAKLASKESRSERKVGKRAKRWKKAVAQYTPVAEGTVAAT